MESSPREVVITVSEPADISSVVLSLSGPQGPVTTVGAAHEKSRDGSGHQTIAVPVTADLAPGLYRMTFTARSAVDGHTGSSLVVFGVRTDVAASALGDDAVSSDSLSDSVRGVLQGVLLLGSGIAFGLLVLAPARRGAGRRLAGVLGVTAMVSAALVGLLWHEGNGLVVAASGLVGAAMLTATARRDPAPRLQTWLACVGLVIAVAPLALVGHAAAQGDLMTMVAVLHVVTTAAWAGTVAAAAVLLRGAAADVRLAVLRRTSVVATTTFLVALVSGLLLSNALVPSVGGALGSTYGWGLVLKVALVLPVLALALLTRERLRGGRATSVRLEAGLLLAVVVVGVFVAAQPPPAAARFQPAPTWSADTAPVSASADDLLVTAQIDPNTPGTRFLVVRVDDTRRPAPAAITQVTVAIADGVTRTLLRGRDGLWTTSVDIAEAGPTSLHVVVTRPGMADATATSTWTVAPRPGEMVGGSPLTRYVAAAIAGLLVAWLLVLILEGVVLPGRRSDGDAESAQDAEQLAEPVGV
jgi:copper transport protein